MNLSTHKSKQRSGEKKLRRKCSVKGCKAPAVTFTALKGWCSPEHGAIVAEQLLARKKAADKKAERKSDKERKEALMDRGDWIEAVQKVFNKFIRMRDADKPCICCGKPFEPQKLGGSMDAGHFLSRGSHPHLRFVEMNVNGQRKNCNRPGGTTKEKFRKGMEARYGVEAVAQLEADKTPRHYTIDDLKALLKHYKEKIRALAKAEA